MGNIFTLISAGIVFILFYALGRWLMDTGLRGRRVGEHPYCKQCGFDLTGKPEASTRCAECGHDLTLPKSTVVGVRHRRWRLALLGVVTMVLCFGVGTWCTFWLASVYGRPIRISWVQWPPESFLVSNTIRGGAGSDAAAQKLSDRRKLSDEGLTRLARHGLTLSSRVNSRKSYQWHRYVVTAQAKGLISYAEWQAYHQAVSPASLHVRPKVSINDPIPFRMIVGSNDLDSVSLFTARWTNPIANPHVEIDGIPVPPHAIRLRYSLNPFPYGRWQDWVIDPSKLTKPIEAGKHSLRVSDVWTGLDNVTVDFDLIREFEVGTHPDLRVAQHLSTEQIEQPEVWMHGRVWADTEVKPTRLTAVLNSNIILPVCLSHRVFLRRNGVDHPIMSISVLKGRWLNEVPSPPFIGPDPKPSPYEGFEHYSGFEGDALVFRPDPSAALETVDVTEYYDQEFVIPIK